MVCLMDQCIPESNNCNGGTSPGSCPGTMKCLFGTCVMPATTCAAACPPDEFCFTGCAPHHREACMGGCPAATATGAALMQTACIPTCVGKNPGPAPGSPGSPGSPGGPPAASRMRCQINATALLPTATICEDANEMACKQIFNTTAPTGMVRDPKCDLDLLQDTVLMCAKTCKVCCETPAYSCEDKTGKSRLPVSCQDQKFLCKDPGWRPLLSQNCPQTCGLCAADGGTGCRDMQTGCSRFKAFCQDTRFITQLRPICAKTCGFCTPGQAGGATGDMATECPGNRELCNNPNYSDIMTRYCCGTCNRCTGTVAGPGTTGGSSNPNCQDTKTECAKWVTKGFCTNAFWSIADRRRFCGRSCSLC